MGWYHTALICLNGHVITDRLGSGPDSASKFCKKCDAASCDMTSSRFVGGTVEGQ